MTAAVWLVGGPVTDDRADLRYSLRSVATNAPWITDVWVVGDCPAWLSDDVHTLPLPPSREKFTNMRQSLTAMCARDDIPDDIIIFNDDHYIVTPTRPPLPVYHMGATKLFVHRLLRDGFNPRNTWLRAVQATTDWAVTQGVEQPYCYEGHVPLPYSKTKLADVLNRYPTNQPFAYPCVYQLAGNGGEGRSGYNVKCRTDHEFDDRMQLNMPYLSSTDTVFHDGKIGRHIRQLFPEPSKYERS